MTHPDKISRRNFLTFASAAGVASLVSGCSAINSLLGKQNPTATPRPPAAPAAPAAPQPTETPTKAPVPTAAPATPTPAAPKPTDAAPPATATKIATATTRAGEMVVLENSRLLVPSEIKDNPDAIARYLLNIILREDNTARNCPQLPYINNPAGAIPHNDDRAPLTGTLVKGQSRLVINTHPNAEVRLYSTGQVVVPITNSSAERLSNISATSSEQRPDGKRNTHMIFKLTRLADGRTAILIPGGKDDDQNINTPKDNVNRGNILIYLPATEQGSDALEMQVDTGSNWLAQYDPTILINADGGIDPGKLIPYLLFNANAQRSEGHGMSTVISMYRGPNCQGKGCRTTDDTGKPIADMAGIGVYILQPDPKSKAFTVLAATVLTDSEIPDILRKN